MRPRLQPGIYSAVVGLAAAGALAIWPTERWIGYGLLAAALGLLVWGMRTRDDRHLWQATWLNEHVWWRFRRSVPARDPLPQPVTAIVEGEVTGAAAGAAESAGPSFFERLIAEREEIKTALDQLRPANVTEALKLYRDTIQGALKGGGLARFVERDLFLRLSHLQHMLQQSNGGIFGEELIPAPKMSEPKLIYADPEAVFDLAGNEVYIREHMNNAEQVWKFQQALEAKRSELQAKLAQVTQQVTSETKRIKARANIPRALPNS